jgi:hypothetical protein
MIIQRSFLVVTLMGLFLLGTRLYGQQEVDPTWYNPWAAQNRTTTHSPRPQVANHKNHATTVARSTSRRRGKLQAKRLVSQRAQF